MFFDLLHALEETIFMVFASGLLTLVVGLPFGIVLYLLSFKERVWQKTFFRALRTFTNTASTIPYLVMVILLIPLLRVLFGTEAGVLAAILPMSLAAIFPFSADIQKSLHALPAGQLDLAKSLGFSRNRWVMKVALKEVLPKIIQQYAHQLNQLMGYSVIAGVFGAGGLGGLLIEKGYQNFQIVYVLSALILLIALMQGIRISLQYLTHGQSH